jgi:lantibiotic modifying enzyme
MERPARAAHPRGRVRGGGGHANTVAASPLPDDTLCHGELGLVELLLTVGHETGQADLIVAAHERAAATIERAAKSGWRLGTPGQVRTPGLMTGMAGIGCAMLRLAAPAEVPSLLALHLDV